MWGSSARAQSSLTPDEYNALVTAVESTTPQPASEAPLFGNFYTITHGESWPPLPANTMGLNYWPLGGNFYLLDDTSFDYPASRAELGFGAPFPTNGAGGGGGGPGPEFSPQYTSSDLWLQITNLVGDTADLFIHPPSGTTAGVYDVLTATNLTQPIQWQWWLRTDPGQTNLTVSIGTNAGTFYALGKPNDFVANDSLGTNFWLVFPKMAASPPANTLELFISSAVPASGTVMILNQSNGPVLIVSGSSNTNANGTYNLTNVTVDFGSYQIDNGSATNAYAKGTLLVFFDQGLGWFLADSSMLSVLYAGTGDEENDLNLNDIAWTDFNNGQNQPGMTNFCAEGPLVQAFTVAASNVATVPIPLYAMAFNPNVAERGHGINVSSSAPVSVYALNYYSPVSAAFTVYPTAFLGTNYYVMSRPAFDTLDDGHSEFAIVATETNTTVSITPSPTADLYGVTGSGTFSTNLQQGQTYLLRSSNAVGDVTGTVVRSDHPIAVFAGASVAFVPDAPTIAANPLVQEQIPASSWGTNVLSLSFAGRTNGDSYRILSEQDGTIINVTGTILTSTNEDTIPYTVTTSNETITVTTNAGQFFDVGIEGAVQIKANKPIQVAHFSYGSIFDHGSSPFEGDPSEILLSRAGAWLNTNIVLIIGTNAGAFNQNYLNLIVPQSAMTNIQVDGNIIPETNFTTIGTSGYSGTTIAVTNAPAVHVVKSPQPISVEVYGLGNSDCYGYLGGLVK